MIEPSEKEIQDGILDYLRRVKHIYCMRMNVGAMRTEHAGVTHFVRFGSKGMSDIIGVMKGGRFLAIEVKRRGGRVSPEQREFIRQVNAEGGLAFVAYSLDDVIKMVG